MDEHSKTIEESFNLHFAESDHMIALGAPKDTPTLDMVRDLLRKNDPTQLTEIMHIHFKFAQRIIRDLPITHSPVREPVGKLKDIVREIYPGKPEDFFRLGIATSKEKRECRAYISDVKMYESPLYTAIGNRGRAEEGGWSRTHQLGLMLRGQEEHEAGLPTHTSEWAADCKCQLADLTSPYVTDAIENDGVYVAGPSGMASMLLGQMEILANFEHEDLKKNYLSAVVAYIVGGGFHSLHEVIGPAQYSLNLVPGYLIEVPAYGKLAPPPNYNQFFEQQGRIDLEFNVRREAAWQTYIHYFSTIYGQICMIGFDYSSIRYGLRYMSGFDVDAKIKDTFFSTPLDYAAENQDSLSFQTLLSNMSADAINQALVIKNTSGSTPLHWAAYKQSSASFQALISKASAETINKVLVIKETNGDTPLLIAAQYQDSLSFQALLSKASTETINQALAMENKDRFGKTLLHWIIEKHDSSVMLVVLKKMSLTDIQQTILSNSNQSMMLDWLGRQIKSVATFAELQPWIALCLKLGGADSAWPADEAFMNRNKLLDEFSKMTGSFAQQLAYAITTRLSEAPSEWFSPSDKAHVLTEQVQTISLANKTVLPLAADTLAANPHVLIEDMDFYEVMQNKEKLLVEKNQLLHMGTRRSGACFGFLRHKVLYERLFYARDIAQQLRDLDQRLEQIDKRLVAHDGLAEDIVHKA